MDISGSKTLAAPREKVFNALQDPTVLKNSVPGCQSAETADDGQLKLVLTTGIPGFKGPYDIFISFSEVTAPSHLVLTTAPSSSLGSVKAVCSVDLAEEGAGTSVNYSAKAELTGKIAGVPEIVAKPAVKSALDGFFSSLEKQIK